MKPSPWIGRFAQGKEYEDEDLPYLPGSIDIDQKIRTTRLRPLTLNAQKIKWSQICQICLFCIVLFSTKPFFLDSVATQQKKDVEKHEARYFDDISLQRMSSFPTFLFFLQPLFILLWKMIAFSSFPSAN